MCNLLTYERKKDRSKKKKQMNILNVNMLINKKYTNKLINTCTN